MGSYFNTLLPIPGETLVFLKETVRESVKGEKTPANLESYLIHLLQLRGNKDDFSKRFLRLYYTIFLPLRIQIRKRSTDIKKNHKISPKSLKIVIVIFFPPNKQQLHWKLIELDLTFHLLVLLLSQGSFEKMFCVISDNITLHSSDAPWSNQSQCPMLHSADRKPRDNHRSPLVSHAADNRTHNFSFVLFLKIGASSETFHLVFQLFLDFTIICVYVMLCMCVCVFTCLCVCEGTCVCVYLSVHVC